MGEGTAVSSRTHLLDQTLGLADGNEGIASLIDLLEAVGSRQLNTDPCLALGYNRVRETDHIDAKLQHLISHFSCQASITQHNRSDWGCSITTDGEASLCHPLAEEGSVGIELGLEVGACTENREHLEIGTDEWVLEKR